MRQVSNEPMVYVKHFFLSESAACHLAAQEKYASQHRSALSRLPIRRPKLVKNISPMRADVLVTFSLCTSD